MSLGACATQFPPTSRHDPDLPETVTAFLIRIHDALKLPPLDEESEDDDSGAEAPADPDGGDPARDA